MRHVDLQSKPQNKTSLFFLFQTANMSLSSELTSVLPVAEPSRAAGHDLLHPNQEVQLEQINEGEMIEEKLVIPDEMERYLSQAAHILDLEGPSPPPPAPPAPPTPVQQPPTPNPACYTPHNYHYCQQGSQPPPPTPQYRNGFNFNYR